MTFSRDRCSDSPLLLLFASFGAIQALYFDSRFLFAMKAIPVSCGLDCRSDDGLSFVVRTLVRNHWFDSQSSL
jgi:hypothetical protein